MEYVKVYKENGELDEELTMIENARIKSEFRMIDRMDELHLSLKETQETVKEAKDAVKYDKPPIEFIDGKMVYHTMCECCKHRDVDGVCTKIRDIFGYELIVENECIFSDNFTFTEVE